MSKKKRNVPRRSANEARPEDFKPFRPSREQLEKRIQGLEQQVQQRTPIEQQASIVAGLRLAVSNYRNRIADLTSDLVQERANLSTAMLSHQQELTKLKEMTALQQEVQ